MIERFKWLQPLSEEIFRAKYMLHGEKGPEEVLALVAKEIASCEKNDRKEEIEKSFYGALIETKLIPGGRVLANARPNAPMKNYNNCFTIGIEDSMEGIYNSLKEDAMVSKMGGGVGFDISSIRPKGDPLSGGGESSGVISFLRIFDQSAKTIMTGGQRRSAHIALLDVSHPDIEEFITIKQGEKNKELTQFNISAKITDDFVRAVRENADWTLQFNGKPYKTLPAQSLYELIARNAFIHNEPGIFNADTIERYNNGWWAFKMDRCNPCGEIVMPAYSLCCLSSVNLSQFVNNPFENEAVFDFAEMERIIRIGVRFLDNILDVTDYPLEKIGTFSKEWRRIGLGFTGLGDALAMLKISYGSDEGLAMIERIAQTLRDTSYSASCDLAEEKGSFPGYDAEKLSESNFIKTLPDAIRKRISSGGLRNIGLNTVAPTGTTSLSVGGNCSSGIEPIFALEYNRNIRTGRNEETATEEVCDYAWLLFKEKFGSETPRPEYFVTAPEIDPYKAIDVQATVQKYIDHSISKTLNLKTGTTFEEYQDLFLYAYDKGLKGFTTFNPEGSMKGVLESKNDNKTIYRKLAPQRPAELPCDIHSEKYKGKKIVVLAGILGESLYEIFVIDDPEVHIQLGKYKKGKIVKRGKGRYDLVVEAGPVDITVKNFPKTYASVNASLARFISMALRHGTPLQFVTDQLNKDTSFMDFERVVSRVLKTYIRDGEEVIAGETKCAECGGSLVFQDGCAACKECGWSKCL